VRINIENYILLFFLLGQVVTPVKRNCVTGALSKAQSCVLTGRAVFSYAAMVILCGEAIDARPCGKKDEPFFLG
jgi:hypothetical protein